MAEKTHITVVESVPSEEENCLGNHLVTKTLRDLKVVWQKLVRFRILTNHAIHDTASRYCSWKASKWLTRTYISMPLRELTSTWDNTVLLATWQWRHSHLYPSKAGTRFNDPEGVQGRVDPVCWLHTEMVHLPEYGHPSNWVRRGVTSFMRWTTLTTMPCCQPSISTLPREITGTLLTGDGQCMCFSVILYVFWIYKKQVS